MSALLLPFTMFSINAEIEYHSAWLGSVSGLKAEKMLRGRNKPYLYVLRKGEGERENETDYYVSYILPDFSIKHQPFVITVAPEGWHFENGVTGGPFTNEVSIDDVLHVMMHCSKDDCVPLIL